jgi:hypothetical protein
MRKLFMLLLAQCIALLLFAQRGEPVNPQKDKLEFQGYTIRVIPADFGTYGYDIFEGKTILVHQERNPFTLSPVGLRKKEDVYKVAKWQIQQLKQTLLSETPGGTLTKPSSQATASKWAKRNVIANQRLSTEVAKELKISIR